MEDSLRGEKVSPWGLPAFPCLWTEEEGEEVEDQEEKVRKEM